MVRLPTQSLKAEKVNENLFCMDSVKNLDGQVLSSLKSEDFKMLLDIMLNGKDQGISIMFLTCASPFDLCNARGEKEAYAILKKFKSKICVSFDYWNDIPNSFFRVRFVR